MKSCPASLASVTLGFAADRAGLPTDRIPSPLSYSLSKHSLADAWPAAGRMWRLCLPALLWAALLCMTHPAMAQFAQASGPKLTASNPVGSVVEQGFSVALSTDGTTAIVGAPFDNSGAGAAWIFKRNNGTWIQLQKLTADDAAGCSVSNLSVCPQFGWSVAMSADGNTVIVGGPGDDGSHGAAWIFTQSNGLWSQVGAKLVGALAAGEAEQGYSVALSADGNTAIVGGWADSSALGAVWVYIWTGTAWTPQGSKISVTDATDTTNILFGFSVALSGDGNLAIIGGPNDGSATGAAWLFSRSAGVWTEVIKLVDITGIESEQGFSVALARDGSTAIVGGPGQEMPGTGTSNTLTCPPPTPPTTTCPNGNLPNQTETIVNMSNGAAWVYTRSNGTWFVGPILAGTSIPISSPGQGFSVALSDNGSTLLLGGPTDNANTGAVWAFILNNGTWTGQAGGKLVGTGASGVAGQGASVALSHNGGTAIIGGALDQNETGAAWSFVFNFLVTVSVSNSSGGTISSSPFNINCQTTCGSSQPNGTLVTFTETPQSGYTFGGWGGACSGTGSCVVTVSMAENVTAMFYITPTRTFVSGSIGDDTTQCSRTAPCATFAAAIAKTAAGGEIDVLDPGVFAPFTITKSITIDGKGWASIAAAGTEGITVNAGSTDVIVLRNLRLNGAGTPGQ